MPVRGDTAGLRQLQRELRELGNWAQSSMNEELGIRAMDLVHESFEAGIDPDGRPWTLPVDGGKPLDRTGSLQSSFSMLPMGRGFVIESSKFWAGVHNEGARITAKGGGVLRFQVGGRWVSKRSVVIPERRFMPEDRFSDVGDVRWKNAIALFMDSKMEAIFGMRAENLSAGQEVADMLEGVQ